MRTSSMIALDRAVGFGIILAMICFVISFMVMGNNYFTDDGVLKALQVDHPEVVEVLDTERLVFDYSRILVKNKDGSQDIYLLDTCILFNYDFPNK